MPRLHAVGLHVTALQNPLTSLAGSATTHRMLELQHDPTVLVAHCWAGTVISGAGLDRKVGTLVHIEARTPMQRSILVTLSGKFPTIPVRASGQKHDGSHVSPRRW